MTAPLRAIPFPKSQAGWQAKTPASDYRDAREHFKLLKEFSEMPCTGLKKRTGKTDRQTDRPDIRATQSNQSGKSFFFSLRTKIQVNPSCPVCCSRRALPPPGAGPGVHGGAAARGAGPGPGGTSGGASQSPQCPPPTHGSRAAPHPGQAVAARGSERQRLI